MLLNNEIKISVKNNGKDNNVQLSLDPSYKLQDVMTCIQMASNTLRDMLGEYLKGRGGSTEKEFDDIFKKITLEDVYAK